MEYWYLYKTCITVSYSTTSCFKYFMWQICYKWQYLYNRFTSSFLIFCVVILCVFTFLVPCCDVHYDFRWNNVRFVFIPGCFYEFLCLMYVLCVCLRIVVSNTYCVVCFFRLVSCVRNVTSFSGLSLRFSLTFIHRFWEYTSLRALYFVLWYLTLIL
jgi:hypothetical protein